MDQRLKSLLESPQLQSILKSIVFGGFLLLVKVADFNFFSLIFFLVLATFLYFRGDVHFIRSKNLYSFIVLLVISLASINALDRPEFLLPAILFFAFLFYITLGIKDLIFTHPYYWQFTKSILLLYSLFTLFFLADKSSLFLLKYIVVFILVFFIFREWLSWSEQHYPKRYLLISLVLAFVVLQALWAIAVLPIGLISGANLMTLIVYLLLDFTQHHLKGTITRNLVLKNLIIFILALLIIFGTSSWRAG